MAILLSSILPTHYRDENDIYHAIAIDDTNHLLSILQKYITNPHKLVLVANDPYNEEKMDEKIITLKESFTLSNMPFKSVIALDHRNMDIAKEILQDADLIILSGGKCPRQKEFFDQINLGDILSTHKGLTIGISAGTMNLGNIVANFPEELADLDEPRWLQGLGFYEDIIIPHFDGESEEYQLDYSELDIVKDYIFPMSMGKTLIGMPNYSYILIDGDTTTYYGDIYQITDGIVTKVN